jgi:hypothetical protein
MASKRILRARIIVSLSIAIRDNSDFGQAANRSGRRSFDAWKDERGSCCLQSWRQTIANRPPVRIVPVRCAEGAGDPYAPNEVIRGWECNRGRMPVAGPGRGLSQSGAAFVMM